MSQKETDIILRAACPHDPENTRGASFIRISKVPTIEGSHPPDLFLHVCSMLHPKKSRKKNKERLDP